MMWMIWMCVMSAFVPGGERLMTLQAQAYESHLRAMLETPAPSRLIGAAEHVIRPELAKLAA